jgi:hypothetical protein
VICGLVWLQELVPKRHIFRIHRIAYPKYGDILNSVVKHNRDNLYDHTSEHENLHFNNDQDTRTSFESYKKSGYDINVDLLTISYQSYVHILGEVG